MIEVEKRTTKVTPRPKTKLFLTPPTSVTKTLDVIPPLIIIPIKTITRSGLLYKAVDGLGSITRLNSSGC